MFCPKCGKPMEDGAAFCAECGAKIDEDNSQSLSGGSENTVSKPKNAAPFFKLIGCGVVLVVVAAAALFISSLFKDPLTSTVDKYLKFYDANNVKECRKSMKKLVNKDEDDSTETSGDGVSLTDYNFGKQEDVYAYVYATGSSKKVDSVYVSVSLDPEKYDDYKEDEIRDLIDNNCEVILKHFKKKFGNPDENNAAGKYVWTLKKDSFLILNNSSEDYGYLYFQKVDDKKMEEIEESSLLTVYYAAESYMNEYYREKNRYPKDISVEDLVDKKLISKDSAVQYQNVEIKLSTDGSSVKSVSFTDKKGNEFSCKG